MKKIMISCLMVLMIIGFSVSDVTAKDRGKQADNYLNLSFFINPGGLGYMHHLGENFYAMGNLDYRRAESDLELRAGGAYFFPIKILLFRLYAGTGIQFSRNEGYQYPYIAIGTKFLFLYTEMIHPMRSGRSAEYRLGFSFSF